MTKDLQEFFRNKKRSSPEIDWKARQGEYFQAVNNLYDKIKSEYLAGPIAEGTVQFSHVLKTMSEAFMGQYDVFELVLQVGDERVVFSPKGRNIVGASGRIDLIGEMGQKTLVLQPGEGWGIVASRTPTRKVVPLDEASLLSALEEVMRR